MGFSTTWHDLNMVKNTTKTLEILCVKTTEPMKQQHDMYCTYGTNLSQFDLKVNDIHDVIVRIVLRS